MMEAHGVHAQVLFDKCLDLCFILDCTGSMGSYIAGATENIELICDEITRSEKLASPECLRVALIAYRDHPPQDNTYITRTFPFTSDVKTVKAHLNGLYASGGGDGPEAVTAALKESLRLDWRTGASRMSVLIADAPPHGIGEYGDGFPAGSPEGSDPLVLARSMASQGISLFVVACEPALSGYNFATDFFRGLAQITSAVMVPLTTAKLLAHVIVGGALEQMDMDRLIKEVGSAVAARVHGNQESVDEVAKALHEKLMLRNESTKQLIVEDIYRDSDEARHNLEIWTTVSSLTDAKGKLQRVPGSRFSDAYNATRYSSRSYSSIYPPIPRRSEAAKGPTLAPPVPVSPTRKVATEFTAFSAPSSMSMAAARAGSPKSRATTAFDDLRDPNDAPSNSPTRPPAPGVTDGQTSADEEDDPMQSVQLMLAGISFDQARRITLQSAWRGLSS